MKKYNVFDLYVVEVQKDFQSYFFLCKYNKGKDVYIEIFTNEKIKTSNSIKVESLSTYYSVFTRYNYKTGKPLMIDKKELLKQYIAINERKKETLKKEKNFNEN